MQTILHVFKTIKSDLSSMLKDPESFFKSNLEAKSERFTPANLVFIAFMHSYFIFLPSYLVMFNILAIIIFFLLLGLMYYFMQEAFLAYQEHSNLDEEIDDRFFYTIAYLFSLAQIPVLILILINNILCLILNTNVIVGVFWATLLSLPIAIFSLYYPLKLMPLITGRENNLPILIEFVSRSFTTTCGQALGLRAIQELWIDFKDSGKANIT